MPRISFPEGITRTLIIGVSAVVCALIIGVAIRNVLRTDSSVTVTGLGETEMASDWISWRGTIVAEDMNRAACYGKIEQSRKTVEKYLAGHGIDPAAIKFFSISIEEKEESAFSQNGNYMGMRFAGYRMKQELEIQSADIDKVENVSREITELISSGVSVESTAPKFYLRNLQDLKLSLIDDATENALVRARKLTKGFASISDIRNIDVGVFQITGLYGNDDFSDGGTFNTSDRMKKVSVTVHATYGLK